MHKWLFYILKIIDKISRLTTRSARLIKEEYSGSLLRHRLSLWFSIEVLIHLSLCGMAQASHEIAPYDVCAEVCSCDHGLALPFADIKG